MSKLTFEGNEAASERLNALLTFLEKTSSKGTDVHLVAFEGELGGLKISEISFVIGNAGASYMRCDEGCANVILAAEIFLETYGEKPYRPDGWESCINEHGEARCRLLRAMGMAEEADQEYAKQLEAEKLIT